MNQWDDLFVDDSWFRNNVNNEVTQEEKFSKEESLSSSQVQKEEFPEDEMIDFSQGDEILNTDIEDDDRMEECSSRLVTFSGLCRVLLEQSIKSSVDVKNSVFYSVDTLSYRAASLYALSMLLESFKNVTMLMHLYDKMAPLLISIIPGNSEIYLHPCHHDFVDDKLPPLIVSRTMSCLGCLLWNGIQYNGDNIYTDVKLLAKLLLKNCGESQAAWTVREASALATSNFALRVHVSALEKMAILGDIS